MARSSAFQGVSLSAESWAAALRSSARAGPEPLARMVSKFLRGELGRRGTNSRGVRTFLMTRKKLRDLNGWIAIGVPQYRMDLESA